MTLTKADIIKSIGKQLGLPKDKSKDIVESVLETIKQTLVNGEEVKISGFGKFYIIEKKPGTEETLTQESILLFPLFFLE